MKTAVERLIAWYHGRKRDVPGRGEPDPYRIWVAEVMAQQTRIATVVPYFETFTRRFPDVDSLAAARLDDVLKAWEGLGYYRRAHNLHRAAKIVKERFGGHLPGDAERLRALPGIGAYTAGAIASMGFGLPEPAVDGNVRRVLSRLRDLEHPTASRLDAIARELISAADGSAAIVNQALMDLGSSVCTPRNPACARCPLIEVCAANREGTVGLRPAPRSRPPSPHFDIGAALVWRGRQLLIARRPESGMLGGLWEFPGGKVESGESPSEAARREVAEELGLEVDILSPAGTVRHAYSHFRITLHLFHARWVAGALRPGTGPRAKWVSPSALEDYAFPAANHSVIRRLARGEERPPEAVRLRA